MLNCLYSRMDPRKLESWRGSILTDMWSPFSFTKSTSSGLLLVWFGFARLGDFFGKD